MKIEVTDHALIVRGACGIPVGSLPHILALAESRGFDLVDAGACRPLAALLVVTSEEHRAALRAEIERRAQAAAGGDALEEWIRGGDTGISSHTIAEILSGRSGLCGAWGRGAPHDAEDFGRCVRLLELIPGWRDRLSEVAEAEPAWAGLVDAWDEVEDLYREELPSGTAPRCYAKMREVL
jgi:hypothetical protein